jgi:hypothetical protein
MAIGVILQIVKHDPESVFRELRILPPDRFMFPYDDIAVRECFGTPYVYWGIFEQRT